MSDPLVIIEEKAKNDLESVKQYMVRKSDFHRLYEELGFEIRHIIGEDDASADDAPEHPIAEAPAEEATETPAGDATEAPATEDAAAPAEQAARIDLAVAPEATPSDAVPTEPAAPVESSTEPATQPAA